MSESIIFAHFLFFGEWFERFTHDRSIPLSNVSKSLRLLTKIREVSESLRLLTKNEQPWAIRLHRSEEMSDRERIAHQKWVNEWIARFFWANRLFAHFWENMSDSLGKPMSEFPALQNTFYFIN